MAGKQKHTTTWEDDRNAGLRCDGTDAGSISVDDGWTECAVCGALVMLHWNVRIETRRASEDAR